MKLTRVVSASSVEASTLDGWQVVDIIKDVTTIRSSVECVQQSYNEYDNANGRQTFHPHKNQVFQAVVTEPLFVLEKDADEASRETALKHDLEIAQTSLKSTVEQLAAIQAELSDITKQRDNARAALDRESTNNVGLAARNTELINKLAAIENEARKIRRYVGEGRWQSIGLEMLRDVE